MATQEKLTDKLLEDNIKPTQKPAVENPPALDWHDFEYQQFSDEPKINFTPFLLIIMTPLLILLHLYVSRFAGIPIIQYAFVTLLTAFLLNYTLIIRKYQLMPYLKVEAYDHKLKLICLLSLLAILTSIYFGWNGSGGLIFAICWQQIRGMRVVQNQGLSIGAYGYFFGIIIIGSLLMEQNFSWMKLIEFIPGLIFGYVNSTLYTLSKSSTYAIAHQFIFLCSVGLPVFFPGSKLIVPNIGQWLLMIVCGVIMLFTVLITIKLMQSARVSVTMAVLCGVLMIGTSSYLLTLDLIGAACIAVGLVLLIKKEFIDVGF